MNQKKEFNSWHCGHGECYSSFRICESERARDYLASVHKKNKDTLDIYKGSFYDKGRRKTIFTLMVKWK